MSDILTHQDAGVMTITFNRLDKKNAITGAMYALLANAIEHARKSGYSMTDTPCSKSPAHSCCLSYHACNTGAYGSGSSGHIFGHGRNFNGSNNKNDADDHKLNQAHVHTGKSDDVKQYAQQTGQRPIKQERNVTFDPVGYPVLTERKHRQDNHPRADDYRDSHHDIRKDEHHEYDRFRYSGAQLQNQFGYRSGNDAARRYHALLRLHYLGDVGGGMGHICPAENGVSNSCGSFNAAARDSPYAIQRPEHKHAL